MMNTTQYCEHCGAALDPSWQFCENCGNRVKMAQPDQPASPPPPSAPAAPLHEQAEVAEAVPQSQRPIWFLPVVGIGCLSMVCAVVLGVSAWILSRNQSAGAEIDASVQATMAQVSQATEPAAAPATATLPEVVALPTETSPPTETALPTATDEPSPTETPPPTEEPPPVDEPAATDPPEPTADPGGGSTGNQHRDATSFFDDFSSDAMGWPAYDDGTTVMAYEDGAYSIQINGKDYFDWATLPVEFSPTSIYFDVWGPPGEQDGTFGVMCHFQDVQNYYYVEIDLQLKEFTIAQSKAGSHIPLTLPNDVGQYWHPIPPLNESPEQVNHIDVECAIDFIMLAVNGGLVYAVDVPEPFSTPGEAALLVYAFSFAGPEGYKVHFDNVEAYGK